MVIAGLFGLTGSKRTARNAYEMNERQIQHSEEQLEETVRMGNAEILSKFDVIQAQHRADERARLYIDVFHVLAAWMEWSRDVTAFIVQPDPRDLYAGVPAGAPESLTVPALPDPSVEARIIAYCSIGVQAAFEN